MAVLHFSGDQVAFFGGINDTGTASAFTSVTAPFQPGDRVEIEIPDQYIGSNGEFDPSEVQFTRVTVVRDGVRYDFDVSHGIDDQGGGWQRRQGAGRHVLQHQ